MGQASGVAGIPASNCDPNLITTVEFVGPNSPNPNKTVYRNDFNNFGPAIGFAWQPRFGGQGKTTIRGGYQMTFGGAGRGGSGAESYLGGRRAQPAMRRSISRPWATRISTSVTSRRLFR